jgi:dihydroorotate dehydrogenase subfamily 1
VNDVDLSVQVAGVHFKNPILPGASELVFSGESALKVAEAGVGGIVTKTFTSPSEYRVRLRPYQFPLGGLNSALKGAGSFYSLASPHVEDMDVVIAKNIPEIAEVCRQKSLPLIASFYERPDEVESWKKVAKGMEKAGADMIELNFSSPTMKGVLEKSPDTGNQIIKALAPQSNVPIGAKISPTLEPLVDIVHGWVQRGLSFVTAHNSPSGIYVDVESESPFGAPAVGGYLIGRPFLPISLARVVQIRKSIDIPVFGVGGVFTWDDALQYLLCGCSLVEIGTAVYVKGMGVFKKIQAGIFSWMERKGYSSITDFRGKVLPLIRSTQDLKKEEKAPFDMPPHTPYVPCIESDKCSLCGSCQNSCFYGVFALEAGKKIVTVDADRCWSCGFCVGICPENAITLVDRATGKEVIWNGRGMAHPFASDKTPSEEHKPQVKETPND